MKQHKKWQCMVNFHNMRILLPELIRKKMKNTINCETKKAKFGFKKGMSKIKSALLNTNFPFMETETSLVYGSKFQT